VALRNIIGTGIANRLTKKNLKSQSPSKFTKDKVAGILLKDVGQALERYNAHH
jgi:hypothetical protein